ncbi:UNVERIFIED_CONTAM: Pentatricopeptide repeat-containing protein [Sesamum calycinum]|uniref:Pentatricopeptide repeat-containing protein n=1 Tax=Sesamum calycinum TaxID=2727403 RepID=A0AAW2QXL3_9LAMI
MCPSFGVDDVGKRSILIANEGLEWLISPRPPLPSETYFQNKPNNFSCCWALSIEPSSSSTKTGLVIECLASLGTEPPFIYTLTAAYSAAVAVPCRRHPIRRRSTATNAIQSYLLLRILNGSFQALDSLKDQISVYFAQFFNSKSGLDLIDSRSISCDRNEKKEISDGEGEPRGAVFNALDAMLKGSLDRLKTMRESISWGHTGSSDAILETQYSSDITMIRALCLEGKLGTALWLWRTMVQQFRIPDVLTHNYLLNGLCKSGDLGRAEWLVKEMLRHGPSPTCATYNTLMSGYCLVNKVDKALDLFSTMADHGIRPNRVSCNILVHTLCQKGLLEDARKLLEKILEDGSDGETSDLITSTILTDGYFKTGNMVEALTCWNDVLQRVSSGHLPDIFTYNTLISNLCKSSRTDEACYVFSVMPRMGVPPDHITYKMIIQGDKTSPTKGRCCQHAGRNHRSACERWFHSVPTYYHLDSWSAGSYSNVTSPILAWAWYSGLPPLPLVVTHATACTIADPNELIVNNEYVDSGLLEVIIRF